LCEEIVKKASEETDLAAQQEHTEKLPNLAPLRFNPEDKDDLQATVPLREGNGC
jgi:hypothetical protein